MRTIYEIIDNNMVTELSIQSDYEFLPCIDIEELERGSDNQPLTVDNTPLQPQLYEEQAVNVLSIIQNDAKIRIKNIQTDNKNIEFEKMLEIYKKMYPDDPFPTGHLVLLLP